METLIAEAPANVPVTSVAPVAPVALATPDHVAKSGATLKTTREKYDADGKDANQAMMQGLELCVVSIAATFIILGIYYLALKVLMRLFPAKAE
jgi:hypothetical protein